jgi:hypothetical protein
VITVGTPLFGEGWPTSPLTFSFRVVGVLAILVALALALTPPRSTPKPSSARLPLIRTVEAPGDSSLPRSLWDEGKGAVEHRPMGQS